MILILPLPLNILYDFSWKYNNLVPVFKVHCWNDTGDIGRAQWNITPLGVVPLAHPLNYVPHGQNIWKWCFIFYLFHL